MGLYSVSPLRPKVSGVRCESNPSRHLLLRGPGRIRLQRRLSAHTELSSRAVWAAHWASDRGRAQRRCGQLCQAILVRRSCSGVCGNQGVWQMGGEDEQTSSLWGWQQCYDDWSRGEADDCFQSDWVALSCAPSVAEGDAVPGVRESGEDQENSVQHRQWAVWLTLPADRCVEAAQGIAREQALHHPWCRPLSTGKTSFKIVLVIAYWLLIQEPGTQNKLIEICDELAKLPIWSRYVNIAQLVYEDWISTKFVTVVPVDSPVY